MTTLHTAHADFAIDFRHNSGVARITGLKEFGYTRQTTGDVAGLTYGTRNLDKNITCIHLLSIFHYNVTIDGEVIGTDEFTVFISDMSGRHTATFL